jgi:RND family efflux transporter MFP subunit
MTRIKRFVVPLAVAGVSVLVAWFIMNNRPDVARQAPKRTAQMTVETANIEPGSYNIAINSYGTIEPRTRGELKSQVNGQIVFVSGHFRAGGYFEKDEVLVKVDPRDFEAQVKISEAALVSARQMLLEEQARSQQAEENWKRLGVSDEPSALVLRLPQLQAAEAGVASAEAALGQARLNLARTVIRAPYAGRVLAIHADIGQVVAIGSIVAEIFAVDALEVRLPVRNQDLQFLDLPESYRFKSADVDRLPKVIIESALVVPEQWSGRVVRTEGAIDEASQQLHVVARVDDPYGNKAEGRQPLKIGQYVSARIEGKRLDAVLVIPNRTIYQGSYVYVVENGLLKRREISVVWHNDEDAIIGSGLKAGDQLVMTTLGQVPSGTPVAVAGEDNGQRSRGKQKLPATNASQTNVGDAP